MKILNKLLLSLKLFVGIHGGTSSGLERLTPDTMKHAVLVSCVLYHELRNLQNSSSSQYPMLASGMILCQAVLAPCALYYAIQSCCSTMKKDEDEAKGHSYRANLYSMGCIALQLLNDGIHWKKRIKSDNPLGILAYL